MFDESPNGVPPANVSLSGLLDEEVGGESEVSHYGVKVSFAD